jgi:hyperosmotically inducible periplasmic protein
MGVIRTVLLLAIGAIVGVLAYNYWSGHGWTLRPASASTDDDLAGVRQRSAELSREATEKASDTATKLEGAMSEGAITAKIKSKMALDDYVNANAIAVDTSGSLVTLTGFVESPDERARAVRLARETKGVTQVIDKLEVRTP